MSTKKNLLVDFVILVGLLIALEPGITGIAVHEWLSIALAITMIVHILLHWDWVINVGVKFFKKLFHSSRLQFVVDVVLLVAFVLVMLSGILISRSVLSVLGIHLQVSRIWELLHRMSADVTLLLTAVHFAQHWSWIVYATKRYVLRPINSILTLKRRQPSTVVIPVEIKNKY